MKTKHYCLLGIIKITVTIFVLLFCESFLTALYMYYVWSICASNVTLPGPPIFWPKVFAFFQVMQSRELVFVDSTWNLDEHNIRFFLLCTHSIAWVLPLGKKMFSRIFNNFIFQTSHECNPFGFKTNKNSNLKIK